MSTDVARSLHQPASGRTKPGYALECGLGKVTLGACCPAAMQPRTAPKASLCRPPGRFSRPQRSVPEETFEFQIAANWSSFQAAQMTAKRHISKFKYCNHTILSSPYANVPACDTIRPRLLAIAEAFGILRHLVGCLPNRLVGQPSYKQVCVACGLITAKVQQP